jgi:hypothetical protein
MHSIFTKFLKVTGWRQRKKEESNVIDKGNKRDTDLSVVIYFFKNNLKQLFPIIVLILETEYMVFVTISFV